MPKTKKRKRLQKVSDVLGSSKKQQLSSDSESNLWASDCDEPVTQKEPADETIADDSDEGSEFPEVAKDNQKKKGRRRLKQRAKKMAPVSSDLCSSDEAIKSPRQSKRLREGTNRRKSLAAFTQLREDLKRKRTGTLRGSRSNNFSFEESPGTESEEQGSNSEGMKEGIDSDDDFIVPSEDDVEEYNEVRCSCGEKGLVEKRLLKKGDWVVCANSHCRVWQHASCVGFGAGEDLTKVKHFCETCDPEGCFTGKTHSCRVVSNEGEVSKKPQSQHLDPEICALAIQAVEADDAAALKKIKSSVCDRTLQLLLRAKLLMNQDQDASPIAFRNAEKDEKDRRLKLRMPLLVLAASKQHHKCFELLLELHSQFSSADSRFRVSKVQDSNGQCTLHHAVLKHDQHLVGLITNRASRGIVHLRDYEGKSALDYAIDGEDFPLVNILLQKCKNKVFDCEGNTAVHIACDLGKSPSFVKSLIAKWPEQALHKNDDGATPVFRATCSGKVDLLQLFWEQYPESFDCHDKEGRSILHFAVESGHTLAIEYILKVCPFLLNQKDKSESEATALHYAACMGFTEVVRLLLAKGALADAKDFKGWPPLLYADYKAQAHETRLECVFALLQSRPEQQLQILGRLIQSSKNEVKIQRLMQNIATNPDFYAFINEFIRDRTDMLNSAFSFFLKNSTILDLENKKRWFRGQIRLHQQNNHPSCKEYFITSRPEAWSKIFHKFERSPDYALKMFFNSEVLFKFADSKISYGPGVSREAIDLICRGMIGGTSKKDVVFELCSDGASFMPRQDATTEHFKIAGVIYGYLLCRFHITPINLNPSFLKLVLGKPISKSDLASFDPEMYLCLQKMLESHLTEESYIFFESSDGSELCKNGCNIPVTDANKEEYVQKLSKHKIKETMNLPAKHFREGMKKVVPWTLLRIFTENELGLLVSGTTDIDPVNWRQHTRVEGARQNAPQIEWFWALVQRLSRNEKSLLLKFATGASMAPAAGFADLDPPFCISLDHHSPGYSVRLPTAATCFNTIYLPLYSNSESLTSSVLTAIRHGCEGFEFL